MMQRRLHWSTIAAICVLCGPVYGGIDKRPADAPAVVDPAPGEIAGCAARGGVLSIAGFSGTQFCAEPAPDAGQSCSRASDCAAWCEAETRICATHLNPFGCRSYLTEDGQVEGICVD